MRAVALRWLPWLPIATALACSAGGDGSLLQAGGHGGHGGAGAGGAGAGGASGGSGGVFIGTGGSATGGGAPVAAEVYGHSSDVLYKLDPVTHSVTVVGPFQGCSSVIDLAMDKDSQVLGTTFDGLYAIDKLTAHCTLIASGSYPNSLSFLPVGTLDPNTEALVGYFAADYVRIDPQGGAVSTVLAGALTGGYISSGDIVSVKGGGTYLTIKGGSCDDCLVEIDPVSGQVTHNYGAVGYSQIFGLAYWGGSAYGFTNGGELFEIDFSGGTISTAPITIPAAPADLSFWGAGSSTTAPLAPPN